MLRSIFSRVKRQLFGSGRRAQVTQLKDGVERCGPWKSSCVFLCVVKRDMENGQRDMNTMFFSPRLLFFSSFICIAVHYFLLVCREH